MFGPGLVTYVDLTFTLQGFDSPRVQTSGTLKRPIRGLFIDFKIISTEPYKQYPSDSDTSPDNNPSDQVPEVPKAYGKSPQS